MNKLRLYKPKLEDLWFKSKMLADKDTMSYNNRFGGTIEFKEVDWKDWYDYWIVECNNERYYRYLVDDNNNFVGEIAYHLDYDTKFYIADIIVYAKYRGKGFGKQGLQLLLDEAKKNGLKEIYDDIAIDNSAIKLFKEFGFYEIYRTDDIIMLKKEL